MFLSTSLLGASRSYFSSSSSPYPPWNFLILYINYTKFLSFSLSLFSFRKFLNWLNITHYNSCLFGMKFISCLFSSGNPLQYRSFFERWQFSPWQNFCPSTIFWAVWLIGDFLCQPCHNGGLNKKEKINAQQCAV